MYGKQCRPCILQHLIWVYTVWKENLCPFTVSPHFQTYKCDAITSRIILTLVQPIFTSIPFWERIHITVQQIEPVHDKTTKWMCVQWRLRSAWASAQSDQSSVCTQWLAKDPSFLHADSETDQIGWCPGWSESSLGAFAILLVLPWSGSILFCWVVSLWQRIKTFQLRVLSLRGTCISIEHFFFV